MDEKLYFVKEHECSLLKNNNAGISITKYKYLDKEGWYLNIRGHLNQILACPYCAMKLDEED